MTTTAAGEVRADVGYLLADADGHYYEPDDCFSRHIGSETDGAIRVVRDSPDDIGRVMLGRESLRVFPTHLSDATFEPGAVRGAVYGDEKVQPSADRARIRSSEVPSSIDPGARLTAMDHWGIGLNVIYPTLALTVWPELVARGPAAVYANLRAFNTWLEEDWGYAYKERIFAAPMVILVDPELAIAELERILERDPRVIALVPTSPRIGVLPGDERFDGFWARVQEAGVAVGIHGCAVAYGDTYSPPDVTTALMMQTATQHLLEVDRQVMDTLASLVLGDVFGRFPGLRVMSIELGSRWVEYLLGAMDRAANQARMPWQFRARDERPSDVFKHHVWVQPFETDDLHRLADVIGVDRILFGSDYPHPEGLENPLQFVDAVRDFSDDEQRKILSENLKQMLGV
jgi:predicted TIM-barrel fold metal-dependent hydrolase